jgi:hypothetical protein
MSKNADFGRQTRIRVAIEAARIMAEEGVDDFHLAKRKAADRLYINSRQALPTNQEIEHELRAYQSLFQGQKQPHNLHRLRSIALKAMKLLMQFAPKLAGPVLDGTAGAHSKVELHVFAEQTEDIQLFLMERHIPFRTTQRSMRVSPSSRRDFPVYQFIADDTPLDIVVFPLRGMRNAPLSPVTGKPMQRATAREVEAIL